MKKYYILEDNMDKLQKKMQRIQKKCNKYGCEFHFQVTGEEFKEVKLESGEKITAKFHIVEAEGIAVINDWKFIACVEHTKNGNVIYKAVHDAEIPEKYYTSLPICEHCHTNRARKETCLIQNTVTGEFKQVGKTCLQDYTHGLSAEVAACYLSGFQMLEDVDNLYQTGICSSDFRYYSTKEMLLYAVETVKRFGYVKSSEMFDPYCTKHATRIYYELDNGGYPYISGEYRDQFKENLKNSKFNAHSEENLQTVEAALKWISEQDRTNDYMSNLITICSAEFCTIRELGFLVSLVPTYNRYLADQKRKEEREAKRKVESNSSNHVGEVGERIEFTIKSMQVLSSGEGQFNVWFLYKFTDAEDNIFTWMTSKYISEVDRIYDEDTDKVHEVSIVGKTLKGTVKAHSEFHGVKQTELTRCKLL